MRPRTLILLALMLFNSRALMAQTLCRNSPDGNVVITDGRVVCRLHVQETMPTSEPLSHILQRITIEADIDYGLMDLLSQLTAHPEYLTLPNPQALAVKLVIEGRELPVQLAVQPRYLLGSGTASLCELQVIDFELRVIRVTSAYFPTYLEEGLRDYINQEPELKVAAVEQARRVLPHLKAHFHCR